MRAVYSGGATEATDQRLARQYQSFRYPKPDAGAEGKRLIVDSASHRGESIIEFFAPPTARAGS
jgi:hypothetical protein